MNVRRHELPNGSVWQTLADGPSAARIVVPIDGITGMSAEEIGLAVKSLLNEARITRTEGWLMTYCDDLLPSDETSDNPNRKYVNLCANLSGSRHTKWPSGPPPDYQIERLRELEEIRSLNPSLEEAYRQICETLDGAYNYLRNRKNKLSEGQELARQIILEMRHGCPLCGLLDRRHTSQCLNAHTVTVH